MNIIIENKLAVLKSGSSFDFIVENRYFTGSDSYTLNIVFPLKGCKENLAIFGHIHRKDVEKKRIAFDCVIRDRNFVKSGCIAIIELNETEVKTQFLEGRSEDNYRETLEDIYINELTLGYPDSDNVSDHQCWVRLLGHKEVQFVALPWVNNTTGNIQNDMNVSEPGLYSWNCQKLSFQPYLIEVAWRICHELGYQYDFKAWENSTYVNILMCNVLPYTWGSSSSRTSTRGESSSSTGLDFAMSLPHWSVIEFFEQLGYFLGGDFEFDHHKKKVSFGFNSDLIKAAGSYKINKVVDSYSAEMTQEDESEYMESANIKYKDCDHNKWNLYSCNWFMKNLKSYYTFNTLEEMVKDKEMLELKKRPTVMVAVGGRGESITYPYGGPLRNNSKAKYSVFYCKDVDTFFTLHCYGVEYTGYTTQIGVKVYYRLYEFVTVNSFGEREIIEDNSNTLELGIVPAWIDYTDKGNVIFLDVPEMGTELDDDTEDRLNEDGSINWSANTSNIMQPYTYKLIKAGDQSASEEYYVKIYVAFWDGQNYLQNFLPCPITERVMMNQDWTYLKTNYSLKLKNGTNNRTTTYKIVGTQKYTFKFLCDEIPNPRNLFYIHGQKYICQKITATFKDGVGMSKLLKGVFYRVDCSNV